MFEVYVEEPPVAVVAPESPFREQKTKLTELTISKSDVAEGSEQVTLSPTLSFASFAVLKAQIEALLLSLPGFDEDQKKWLLSSLQFCDDDFKLVELLASTFDPRDFQEPRVPRGQKVYLRAKVSALPATDPTDPTAAATATITTTTTRQQRSTALPPPPTVTQAKKMVHAAARTTGAPRRRALGRRDGNTLPAATPAQTAAAAAREGRGGGTWSRKTVVAKKPAVPARSGTAAKAARPPPQAAAAQKDRRAAMTTAATPQQQRKLSPGSAAPANSAGNAGSCKVSRRERAPAYVFKAGGPSSSSSTGNGSKTGGGGEVRPTSSKPPVSSCGRHRGSAGALGTAATKKPGWTCGNEPMWEEAERKRAITRREARARILRKRATAAFKQALGGRGGAGGRGGNARVFRRGRRECLVTDTRRKRLGGFLLCDSIGAPPSPLGKRKLDTYRELGRAAAAQMKYLAIADCDPTPKRGRGEGTAGGKGSSVVVFRRGDVTPTQVALPVSAAAAVTESVGDAVATWKMVADKRIVVVASNASCSVALARKGGAVKSPSNLPAALRPPTARPGDIGFFRGGAGFRMRPPPKAAGRGGAGAAAGAATATPAVATPGVRGRDGSGGGGRGSAGVSAGRGQGVAALTTAAAGKVRPRASNASVRSTGRSSSSSSSASVRGSARQRGGRMVAADKEAAGVRAKNDDASAAAAIMAKLAGGGRGSGRGGGGAASSGGENVESLQEQVALLKAAAGLSDEELTWRMETAKPEANAYRIASAALERAETTYERLLWRQGQLQIARARLTGRGVGGDAATAAFATAVSRFLSTQLRGDAGGNNGTALSRLGSASEGVLTSLQETPAATAATSPPADVATREVRAAAGALAKLVAAVLATASTGSEVDYAAVTAEVAAEARALRERADGVGKELAALDRRVEQAVGQMEAWQQRKAEAPEFQAEEAAREEAWNEANRRANQAALQEMRALLPEAVWDMNAGDIQAAAAGAGGSGSVFYPSDLCVRLRECRPLHWLVSAPEDIAGANFLAGDGAAAFTQLEGMDLTEMRAVWSVLPREFSRDADRKKAEWRARFRVQLEGLARQQDGAVVTAGWDPVRGKRATTRMPPLPAHRVRHPAYFYPTAEATASRVSRLRDQRRRLAVRKERLSALETELVEAKREVDAACADARCGELRKRYGAETLRAAREAAKGAHSALARERKSLVTGVAEAERMLSSMFPSLEQLESEAESIAQIIGRAPTAAANSSSNGTTTTNNNNNNSDTNPEDGHEAVPATGAASTASAVAALDAGAESKSIRVPGAFSEEPELRRRAAAAAKKLTPEEERRLRASEVQRAVSSRGDGVGVVPVGGSGGDAVVPDAGTACVVVAAASADDAVGGGDCGGVASAAAMAPALVPGSTAAATGAVSLPSRDGKAENEGSEVGTSGSAAGSTDGGGCNGNDAAVCESAPPPRRPVKVAPGVLALLTKQHGARAAAVTGSGSGGGSGGGRRGVEGGISSEVPRPPVSEDAAAAEVPLAGAAAAGSKPPSGEESAPSGAAGGSTGGPPTAAPPVKPMSKSLAALLARRADDPPVPGSTVVARNVDACSGAGGSVGAGKKAIAPSLGFLGELKARAAAKQSGGSVSMVPPEVSASEAPAGRKGMLVPVAKGGGSFLEELKARTAKIS